jgi:16S rRNA (guanine1516-N2)-methyltransferase
VNLRPPPDIAVVGKTSAFSSAAAVLALELQLPLATDPLPASLTHLLVLNEERLELRELGPHAPGPVYADFTAGAAAHRRRFGGGRHQPLARAVGLKSGVRPTVVDATAGLGRDAFVLACLGCVVHLVERSPIIAALLRDGLRRAARDPEIGSLAATHLRLTVADGREFLGEIGNDQRPDVVYLDPMYPRRGKSALPGKELRLLRRLIGDDDDDAPELLAIALAQARRRVVVKRPRRAPSLAGPAPTMQIAAPNTRFDVYLVSDRQLPA